MKSAGIRFRIDFSEHLNLGPGKIALLESIDAHGSLVTAAASLGLSYRRAWLLLDSLNKTFRKPVTRSSAGGKSGGKSTVTEFGRLLIRQYRRLESEIDAIGSRHLEDVLPHVMGNSNASTSARRRPLTRKLPLARVKNSRSTRS